MTYCMSPMIRAGELRARPLGLVSTLSTLSEAARESLDYIVS